MTTAISVENLSKSYRLGVIGTGTFYGDLKRWWAKQRGKPDPYLKIGEVDHGNRDGETVWALQDINFSVERGEAVGIIGRNGAGKSTLLKILSRVTAPTTGSVKVKGRIASLLEVGTGFHPELTGRENIYMNGAILGMSRQEIAHRFDEIVEFSGVGKYIDTPVKRYSSGMYVRLAFAVAAHLEPEILIVDEVLAVGDAEFQKKCLGKMGDVAQQGRTVLFVSHNMGAIESLCKSCILFDKGALQLFTRDVSHAVRLYMSSDIAGSTKENPRTLTTDLFKVEEFGLKRRKESSEFYTKADAVDIELKLDVFQPSPLLSIGYALYESESNQCLWWSFHVDTDPIIVLKEGVNVLKTSIPAGILNDGDYRIELLAALHNQRWILEPGKNDICLGFSVQGGLVGSVLLSSTNRPTLLFPVLRWKINDD